MERSLAEKTKDGLVFQGPSSSCSCGCCYFSSPFTVRWSVPLYFFMSLKISRLWTSAIALSCGENEFARFDTPQIKRQSNVFSICLSPRPQSRHRASAGMTLQSYIVFWIMPSAFPKNVYFCTIQKKTEDIMASITLEYDGRNTAIKKALDLILYLGARVKRPTKRNALDEALLEVERGKIVECDSVEDMFNRLEDACV